MVKEKETVRELGPCKKEIEIEIPAAKVKKEFEETLRRFGQSAKLKGFRPGKVPLEMIKSKYYEEIKDSVVNSIVPDAVSKELHALDIHPVGSPVVTELSFEEDKPLTFKAQVETWPDFELPEYKNLEVKKDKVSVTADDVKKALEDLQNRSLQYIPTEGRGVKDGDYVVTEILSRDKQTQKAFPREKVVILAGHPENEKTLNENLLGMEENATKDFSIAYPEDHHNKKLAGKDIAYTIKVLSIKEKKLPAIDDDFAKEIGEFQNLKDLKAQLKKELLLSKENIAKRKLSEDAVGALADKVTVELPEMLVEEEALALVRRSLSSQPPEVQKALKQEDVQKLKEEMTEKAKQNLKNHLLLSKVAEKENLKVEGTEIDEEIAKIARANQIPLAKAQESLGRDEIKDNLLLRKTIDFLLENAIIKET